MLQCGCPDTSGSTPILVGLGSNVPVAASPVACSARLACASGSLGKVASTASAVGTRSSGLWSDAECDMSNTKLSSCNTAADAAAGVQCVHTTSCTAAWDSGARMAPSLSPLSAKMLLNYGKVDAAAARVPAIWTHGLRSIAAGALLACMQVRTQLVPRTCLHTTLHDQHGLSHALTTVNFVLAFTLTRSPGTQQ